MTYNLYSIVIVSEDERKMDFLTVFWLAKLIKKKLIDSYELLKKTNKKNYM